jgi:RHS repeat-associated protein
VWSQTFGFDAFGNITKTANPGTSFQPVYKNPTTQYTSNRYVSIPGTTVSYDNNGNVLNDGSHQYAWDADGNSVTVDGVGVTFDALDRMVEQNRAGVFTQIVYAPTSDKLALMSGQNLQKAFVPLPANATAVYTASGLDHYRHPDWLGSARFASTASTRAMYSDVAYAPFGEQYAQAGVTDLSFTGMNSDTVPGDYDFLAREYGSTQGRWPSPDPAGLSAADSSSPQSWNRYAYVLNNPLSFTDPLGLDKCYFESGVEYTCIDPMFQASYNGPAPTPGYQYNQIIVQFNNWMTAHNGIYDSKTDQYLPGSGMVWSSCAPAGSGLSNSCTPGYKGGGEGKQGFLWAINRMQYDLSKTKESLEALLKIDPANKQIIKDLADVESTLKSFTEWSLEQLPPDLKPSVPCSRVIGQIIMSPWNKALQDWIKANPGQPPPPWLVNPPDVSGVAAGCS